MENKQLKYAAFISYRHLPVSMEVATALHHQLERYTIPKKLRKNGRKHLGRIFLDTQELPTSSDLNQSIRDALDQSEYLIVLCMPEINESRWMLAEIEYFLCTHPRSRILTVLVRGRPEEAFPKLLTQLHDQDGQVVEEIEPLAADVVAASLRGCLRLLGRQKLKVIAGMLGCSYDSLYNRDLRWRRQRRSAAVTVALTLMLAFIGMLLYKNGQISRQLEKTQLQESKALTYIACDQMSQGDRAGAMRTLLTALPSSGLERSFYPPAQAALIDSLQIYRDSAIGLDRVYEAEAPISSFTISHDQQTVYALSEDYRLYAFNAASGEKVWMQTGEEMLYLYPLAHRNAVMCCGSDDFALLDQASGECLLSQKLPGIYQEMPATYFHGASLILPDRALTLYLGWDRLLIYEIGQQITLLHDLPVPVFDDQNIVPYLLVRAAFDEASGRFAFTLFANKKSEDSFSGGYELYLVSVDLVHGEMTTSPIFSCQGTTLSMDYTCGFVSDGSSYVVYVDWFEEETCAHIRFFDKNGKQNGSADVPVLQHNVISLEQPSLMTYQQGDLLIGAYGSSLFCVDLAAVSLCWVRPLPSNCIALAPEMQGACTFVLRDGTISRATLKSGMLPLGDGVFQYHSGIPLYNAQIGSGTENFLVILPQEEDNRLLGARLMSGALLRTAQDESADAYAQSDPYILDVDEEGTLFIVSSETGKCLTMPILPEDVQPEDDVRIRLVPGDNALLLFHAGKSAKGRDGYCIDLPSGQVKAVIPGLTGFDPLEKIVYRYMFNSVTLAYDLAEYPYYTLDELIEQAHEWLLGDY